MGAGCGFPDLGAHAALAPLPHRLPKHSWRLNTTARPQWRSQGAGGGGVVNAQQSIQRPLRLNSRCGVVNTDPTSYIKLERRWGVRQWGLCYQRKHQRQAGVAEPALFGRTLHMYCGNLWVHSFIKTAFLVGIGCTDLLVRKSREWRALVPRRILQNTGRVAPTNRGHGHAVSMK